MELSFVLNQSTVKDGNNQPVQRVVDAAPWGYDEVQDAIKVISPKLIQKEALLRAQLYTYSRLFSYPLQEIGGSICYDYSENGYDAQYNSVNFGKVGPTDAIDRATKFTGSSYVLLPKSQCSVKGLAAITFEAVIQVVPSGLAKHIFLESVFDGAASSRFCIQLTTDNKISVLARTGLMAQTLVTVTTNSALTDGCHIIAVSLDVVAKEILIYVDGSAVTTTGTIDFGTDTAFANTLPMGSILLGSSQTADGATIQPNYVGIMAYVSMYKRKVTAATLLAHAKAGGFA